MTDESRSCLATGLSSGPRGRILGVSFSDKPVEALLLEVKKGGLLVVPSAPVLVQMDSDEVLREAEQAADHAIADSMLMVLVNLLLRGRWIHRISGLTFLHEFLAMEELRGDGALFLVNPDEEEGRANQAWLAAQGIRVCADDMYAAPMYDALAQDLGLLTILNRRRPKYVLLNLGGGVQEKLGYYLRMNLDYRPPIICTGAAIAFLTGRQAPIPIWADKAGLGWLFRCAHNPSRFVPRYMAAFKLVWIMVVDRFRGIGGTENPAA